MTETVAEQASLVNPDCGLNARVRRFSLRLMAVMVMLCNLVILVGIWASGVNPDTLFTAPDHFSQSRDVCLRHSWHKVAGVQQPVRLCYEWINLSDPSGNTHTFQADVEIVMGADSRLHYGQGESMDTRLAALLAFAGAVCILGIVSTRWLIRRYRRQIESAQHNAW
ncbi:MAG: hypothetical protein ACKOBZ_01750 [Nitrospira sp.]|nr:hypothetical protein [Nitrospira sp.]